MNGMKMRSPSRSEIEAGRVGGGGSEVLVVCSRYVQRPSHRRCDDGSDSCKAGLSQDPVRDIDL